LLLESDNKYNSKSNKGGTKGEGIKVVELKDNFKDKDINNKEPGLMLNNNVNNKSNKEETKDKDVKGLGVEVIDVNNISNLEL